MAQRAHKKGPQIRKEPKEFDEQVIQIDRVTKVVKGGRRLRFRATVAIGNRKGKVGIGIGKSNEVTGAIQKAIAKAKRSLITVNLDGSTIPHDLKISHKSSQIIFLPAAPGTGIIAGGSIRKVLELAGVKDILSKSYGTTNKVNNTKATYTALSRLKNTPLMEKKKEKAQKEKLINEEKTANQQTAKQTPHQKSDKPNKTNKPAKNTKPAKPEAKPEQDTK